MAQALRFRSPSLHFEHDFRAREDVQVHLDIPYLHDEVITLSVGIDGRLAQRKTKPASQRGNTAYEQNFEIRWDAKVIHLPEAWLALIRIPFAQLHVRPRQGLQLGVNFTRNEFVIPEFTVWRGVGYWTVIPEKMGRLVLAGQQQIPEPLPTVTLTADPDRCCINTDAGEDCEIAVNACKLDPKSATFKPKPFSNNEFNVTFQSRSLHRSIPVASDEQLMSQPQTPAPDGQELLETFEGMHRFAESLRCGDGLYRNGPDAPPPAGMDTQIHRPNLSPGETAYRQSAWRALAYLFIEPVKTDPTYAATARQCLDWLLRQQRADGCMPYWAPRDPFAEQSAPVEMHTSDCFYENGNVGWALLEGYKRFGQTQYLSAAARIGQFNVSEPPSHNANYNAFCLLFQPQLTHLTGDETYLRDAVHKYRTGIAPGQMLNGEWPGHNRHSCYMGIIGLALARLAAALPSDSDIKTQLRRRAIRIMNCFISRLDHATGITHHHPNGTTTGGALALLAAVETADAFGLELSGLMNHLAAWIVRGFGKQFLESHVMDMLAMARYIHWQFARS